MNKITHKLPLEGPAQPLGDLGGHLRLQINNSTIKVYS
jgi:hypothetical protein